MSLEDADTSRARIQTYVPQYQKAEWERHASDLDMSLSEFVRSMVQAGRTRFDGDRESAGREESRETPSSPAEPPESDLEERVLRALPEDGYLGWDELLAEVTDDVEGRLDETLGELRNDGRVRHSGRHGGYTVE